MSAPIFRLRAASVELGGRGYERRPGEAVDFTVYYQLWVTDGGDLAEIEERWRGRIYARDVATGRRVWRGERKTPVTGKNVTRAQQSEEIRRFAADILQHTRKLEEPARQD